jgi:L-fuconolactonase
MAAPEPYPKVVVMRRWNVNTHIERIVDSHVHLWDCTKFDYEWLEGETGALRHSFLPVDLEEALDVPAAVVSDVVAVQADCRDDQAFAEAQWLEGLADAGAPIMAIVASAPLELGERCRSHVEQLIQLPRVSGVRRLLQDRPSGFATAPEFVAGVKLLADYGLSMDLCIRQRQLGEVWDLVSQCPEVVFVLDHVGKPVVESAEFGSWAADLARLASLPNVRCKISGLATEAPDHVRTVAGMRPWIDHAITVFGPGRCLYGSDWPVVTTASSYAAWIETILATVSSLPESEQTAILGLNALATYDPARRQARMKELDRGAH